MRLFAALLLLSLVGFSQTPPAPTKIFSHLKSWANEYPINNAVRPRRNFFKLPEIDSSLHRILDQSQYKRLLDAMGLISPIDVIDQYLVIKGVTNPHSGNDLENALVAVRLYNGDIFVAIEGEDGHVDWYCTAGKYTDLPDKIRAEIDPEAAIEWGERIAAAARAKISKR